MFTCFVEYAAQEALSDLLQGSKEGVTIIDLNTANSVVEGPPSSAPDLPEDMRKLLTKLKDEYPKRVRTFIY